MTSKLGIIGYPIGHSISPVFQQAALDHYGIDGAYQAYRQRLNEILAQLEG